MYEYASSSQTTGEILTGAEIALNQSASITTSQPDIRAIHGEDIGKTSLVNKKGMMHGVRRARCGLVRLLV